MVRAATQAPRELDTSPAKTYQPDSTWRWMGSIASDNQGNIALGFSASSETIHPQIRYAGRLATDPLNILSGERHLFDGTGSQIDRPCDPDEDPDCDPEPPTYRWGDYSDMTVDPVDDCTFYYTNEYLRKDGRRRKVEDTDRLLQIRPGARHRTKELLTLYHPCTRRTSF